MSFDELEEKIINIKKRGLNNFVENQIIADLRREYYEKALEKKMVSISNRFRSNIFFLNRIHKENLTVTKIKEFMGIEFDFSFNKILYENHNVYSLRFAIVASEFFGLPVELLLFTDLEANEHTIKKEYPALFRQSRD